MQYPNIIIIIKSRLWDTFRKHEMSINLRILSHFSRLVYGDIAIKIILSTIQVPKRARISP